MEGGLSRSQKIDRARRNTLKAASLVLGAVLATGALHKLASAAPGGNGNGNGGTNGNDGNGNNNNNQGGNCFARGTQIRTREGYRPIETLAAGRRGCGAFWGLRADQVNGQFHLEQRVGQMGWRVEFAGSHTAWCSGRELAKRRSLPHGFASRLR
jgi:hypothetical protein